MNPLLSTFTADGHRQRLLSPGGRRASAVSRALTILGSVMLITFLATLVGMGVDHRVITGAPAWLKPAKFAVSVSLYCFTLVWLLGFVENRPRLVRVVANLTVAGISLEMIAIITQAARGTTSHFNASTPLDAFLWIAMGVFIVLVWAMNLLLAILLIGQRIGDTAFAWSLRLGVLISSLGMAVAFFMVRPTPEQVAAITGGHGTGIVGAHSVGVRDGGPGLPVVGWSTAGGDLRVAHFVGLHALQVLPFLGWLVTRRKGLRVLLAASERMALVWTAGLAYLGLMAVVLWQALRGQSLVNPDIKTIAAAAALSTGAAGSVLIVLARVWNRNRKGRVLASAVHILTQEEEL